jgi:hypothetical protein
MRKERQQLMQMQKQQAQQPQRKRRTMTLRPKRKKLEQDQQRKMRMKLRPPVNPRRQLSDETPRKKTKHRGHQLPQHRVRHPSRKRQCVASADRSQWMTRLNRCWCVSLRYHRQRRREFRLQLRLHRSG